MLYNTHTITASGPVRCSRMNLNLYRDRQGFLNRCVLLPVFVPFIVIFLGRLGHGQTSIQDRIGLLYQTVQVPPYVGIVHAVALCESANNLFVVVEGVSSV